MSDEALTEAFAALEGLLGHRIDDQPEQRIRRFMNC
jgi:ATP-dependent helicase HepA